MSYYTVGSWWATASRARRLLSVPEELLNVRAADAVFVGDDPQWDVMGAERAGIRPLLLARKSGNMSGGGSLGRTSEDPGVAESLRAVGESLRRAAPT